MQYTWLHNPVGYQRESSTFYTLTHTADFPASRWTLRWWTSVLINKSTCRGASFYLGKPAYLFMKFTRFHRAFNFAFFTSRTRCVHANPWTRRSCKSSMCVGHILDSRLFRARVPHEVLRDSLAVRQVCFQRRRATGLWLYACSYCRGARCLNRWVTWWTP